MGTDRLHVVVTGGSSGIGEAVAYEYARRGAMLALFARRRPGLERVAARCQELGAGGVLVLPGDTTSTEDVTRAMTQINDAWPRLDRAFLNAGGYGDVTSHSLAEVRDVEWSVQGFSAASAESVMRTNYCGVVKWLEPVLQAMRKTGSGSIAITGSMAADRGHPRHGPYAASKAALRALVDATRSDARRHGIHLCLIEPGCVVSAMTESQCCAEMPFLQPTEKAARRFVSGVEARERVIRFPWRASMFSQLMAALPRPIFDRWALGRLPRMR